MLSTKADPAAVWDSFIHIEAWPQWIRSIRAVRRLDEGPLRPGSSARISQPGLLPATWTVTRLDPGRVFSWESTAPGVVTAADHEVSVSGDRTDVVLRIRQRGPLAPLVRAIYGRRIRRFLDLEARGHVRAAEAAAAT